MYQTASFIQRLKNLDLIKLTLLKHVLVTGPIPNVVFSIILLSTT